MSVSRAAARSSYWTFSSEQSFLGVVQMRRQARAISTYESIIGAQSCNSKKWFTYLLLKDGIARFSVISIEEEASPT